MNSNVEERVWYSKAQRCFVFAQDEFHSLCSTECQPIFQNYPLIRQSDLPDLRILTAFVSRAHGVTIWSSLARLIFFDTALCSLPHDNHIKSGIVGAQTKGQLHLIYGTEGTQALFTGLAMQIVYSGCDHDTASFYSKASGTTTADANPDPQKANFRQRPLLTVDEVVTPQVGNCTIFARYVEPAFATQVILTARLTRLYEREYWQARFATSKNEEPLTPCSKDMTQASSGVLQYPA